MVSRANLDGKNIKKLFGRPRVEWPNGISIDYIAERIYWVDARQDYIASSDLHGDYFKVIVSHDEVVSHPFAVAVFKNTMYWDDWKRNSIFSADKDIFHGVEIIQKQLPGLMDLKVYAIKSIKKKVGYTLFFRCSLMVFKLAAMHVSILQVVRMFVWVHPK